MHCPQCQPRTHLEQSSAARAVLVWNLSVQRARTLTSRGVAFVIRVDERLKMPPLFSHPDSHLLKRTPPSISPKRSSHPRALSKASASRSRCCSPT